MTLVIARHEFRRIVRDGRFRWAAGLVFALLLAAVASGWHYRQTQERERAHAHAAEHERWYGQGHKDPHGAAHYGIYAFKPASPFSAVDPGIEPYVGVSVWLEAHNMNEFVYRPAQDGSALSRFGELTPALVLQVLLPLVIVLVGYGVFASERETGTLRQVVSLGVAPAQLLAGKALALAAALGLVLVPAMLLAIAAVSSNNATRFSLLIVSYAAYLAVFLALTLAVSARAPTARQALVVLLGIWILACLAWPRLAADLAAWRDPTPSAIAFREAMQKDQGESHSSDRALAVRARVMKQYGVTRPEDLPIDWRGISLQESEEANFPIFDRHFGALFDTYRAQLRTQQWSAILSPLLAVAPLSAALAGTDLEHHWRFVTAAEAHRRVIQKVMNDDITLHAKEGVDYRAGPEMWRRIAQFRPPPPALSEILPSYTIATAALVVWFFAAVLFALRSIRTLRP